MLVSMADDLDTTQASLNDNDDPSPSYMLGHVVFSGPSSGDRTGLAYQRNYFLEWSSQPRELQIACQWGERGREARWALRSVAAESFSLVPGRPALGVREWGGGRWRGAVGAGACTMDVGDARLS